MGFDQLACLLSDFDLRLVRIEEQRPQPRFHCIQGGFVCFDFSMVEVIPIQANRFWYWCEW